MDIIYTIAPRLTVRAIMETRIVISALVSTFKSVMISHLTLPCSVLRIRPPGQDDGSVPPRFRNTLVHPTSSKEVRADVDPAILAGNGGGMTTMGGTHNACFSFDHVLGETSSQIDLYDVTGKEVLEDFIHGHNVTFLA